MSFDGLEHDQEPEASKDVSMKAAVLSASGTGLSPTSCATTGHRSRKEKLIVRRYVKFTVARSANV